MAEERKKQRRQYLMSLCGLLLLLTVGILILLFSLSDSWMWMGALATLALYASALAFFEFGSSGNWFPGFAASKSARAILARGLAAIAGLALLLLTVGECFALGPGKWKVTITGFVFGLYNTAFLLVRYAITGVWWPDWGRRSPAVPSTAPQ